MGVSAPGVRRSTSVELGLHLSDLVVLDGRSLRAIAHLALLRRHRDDPLGRAHQALPGELAQVPTRQDLRPGLAFCQVNVDPDGAMKPGYFSTP